MIINVQQQTLILRKPGLQPYLCVFEAMHQFTEYRNPVTPDEIWLVQHQRVFTQGRAGKARHIMEPRDIPVIHSDRGGQVTYHGPGQQIMYVMVDLKRAKIGVRQLVNVLENTVIKTLAHFGITSCARMDAPGVYVGREKICSLGLRIHKGCSLHGLALNIDMDLEPFQRINPCGYEGMQMTQMSSLVAGVDIDNVAQILVHEFMHRAGYETVEQHSWNINDYLLSVGR